MKLTMFTRTVMTAMLQETAIELAITPFFRRAAHDAAGYEERREP